MITGVLEDLFESGMVGAAKMFSKKHQFPDMTLHDHDAHEFQRSRVTRPPRSYPMPMSRGKCRCAAAMATASAVLLMHSAEHARSRASDLS